MPDHLLIIGRVVNQTEPHPSQSLKFNEEKIVIMFSFFIVRKTFREHLQYMIRKSNL